MKRFRIALLVAAVFVTLLLVGVIVLFSTSFQTWAARRALASRSDLRGTIGEVSVGFGRVVVRDLRIERDGAVLTLPSIEAELPVLAAAFSEQVRITRLVAKDWILDLSRWNAGAAASGATVGSATVVPPARRPASSVVPTESSPAAPPGAARQEAGAQPAATPAKGGNAPGFHGVLQQVQFPFDLALDGVDLRGEVVLPAGRGRVRANVAGGGLGAGRTGRFAFSTDAALSQAKVSSATLRGSVVAKMDTPRTLGRLAITAAATAAGTQFPDGIKLATDIAATRAARAESYSLNMISDGRQVLAVQAELPRDSALLAGTWKADIRHADLAPFAMGRPLPEFTLVGDGRFDTDATFAAFHAAGRASGTVGELRALLPQLSAVAPITVVADFDVGRRGDAISIRKLEADLANGGPVARFQSLQTFEFNPATAELRAENADRDLFDLIIHALPVAWAKPFVPDFAITGGDLRGELVALMRAGGTTLRTKTPLTLEGVSVAQDGKTLVKDVALSLAVSTDYTPHGWQAEIGELAIRSGEAPLLILAAKAGQLPGDNQPVKATGKLTADLPGVLAQPAVAGALALTRGEATLDFTASLGATKEVQAKLAVAKLAVATAKPAADGAAKPGAPKTPDETLPAITADIRADLAADGQLAFNAPLLIERNSRKSDLTIVGTMTPAKDFRTIDAQVTSDQFIVDDAKIMAALLPPEPQAAPGATAPAPRGPEKKPFWSGFRGTLGLRLKKVIYSETYQASDVAGTLRLDEGSMKLDALRMGMGEGEARIDGVVSFDAGQPQPYEFNASVAMRDVDPGPLLRALNPAQPATIEGKFTLKSDVTARGESIEALPPGLAGDVELTSRGGVFRGLPVNVGNLVESTNKLTGWLATAGSALGVLTGKKDYSDVTSKAQAVAEFAKSLNPITFDQLNVRVSRDEARNIVMKDFTLISPEIRLTGEGQMSHRDGAPLLDDALAMQFTLRARGRQGDLLKYLGMLEAQPDQLGYSACTLPFTVGGTLRNPDTSEVNQRLVTIALEKSGVGEKAAELLQKFRGNRPTGGE